jgi:nitrite reductase/ring-hydroxylating ferredoxin subunit
MARVAIGALSDFPDGRGVGRAIGGYCLAVFRVGDRVFAVDDQCSHRGFPLSDGVLEGPGVRCRTHGACFDLVSGAVLRGPARRAVHAYAVEVVDGQVIVELG